MPEYDLFHPAEFGKAIKAKIGRPFMFGPIEFADLDSESFDGTKQRNRVQTNLEKRSMVAEPGN